MDKKILRQLKHFNLTWAEIMRAYDDGNFTADNKVMYYLIEQEQNEEDATQTGLCDVWMINKQTANSAVKRLEKAGYLICQEAADDRRKKILRLTETGRKAAYEEFILIRRAEIRAFEDFAEGEAEEMLRLMDKFAGNLKQEVKNLYQDT